MGLNRGKSSSLALKSWNFCGSIRSVEFGVTMRNEIFYIRVWKKSSQEFFCHRRIVENSYTFKQALTWYDYKYDTEFIKRLIWTSNKETEKNVTKPKFIALPLTRTK